MDTFLRESLSKEMQDLSLLDEEFLATLLEQKERIIYAKISALDINELPIDTIEGKVTGGSINIDGASSVRRTCNLTMISDEVDINNFYWGLKTKFKLEIGLVNNLTIEPYRYIEGGEYPSIVWFPEGIFLVTGFNTSLTTNNCTISLSGKDKMCLLNGDLGGQLFASIDFGQEEEKIAIMTKKEIEASTSDVILSNSLYLKYPDFLSNEEETLDKISSFDQLYIFLQDPEGLYYKKDGDYVKVSSFEIGNRRYLGTKYTPYKLVTKPSEIFTELTEEELANFEKNKYYRQKSNSNNSYYVLEKRSTPRDSADTYYKTKNLYSLDYEYTIKKIPLEKIIRESVHAYAKEPYHNIIINDLDDYGLEQLTYRGDDTLYALRNAKTTHFTQLLLSGRNQSLDSILTSTSNFLLDPLVSSSTSVEGSKIYRHTDNKFYLILYEDRTNRPYILLNNQTKMYITDGDNDKINTYTVAAFNFGDDIGYRITDLTYTGDLVTNIGDSLTTMLDKIKAMLGDFEYFYDTEGHFIFQRKRTFINTSWSYITESEDETYVDYGNSDRKKFSFNFEGNRLVTAVQNTPVLNNLRNDFSVWGKRKSVSGAEIPIHARYAIDKKPVFYKSIFGKTYITEEWMEENESSSLISEIVVNAPTFEKAPVPQCLWNDAYGNSDWWEVSNWGKWYELQVGAPPSGRMMNYQTGTAGFKGVIRFPNGKSLNCTNSRYGQLMIDLDENGNPFVGAVKADNPKLPYGSYNQHGWGGCYHDFLLVLNTNKANPGMHSYIYKPTLPDLQTQLEDIEHASENPLTESKTVYIVDWREIIYQMALDYFAGQGCSSERPIYDINNNLVMTDPDHLLSEISQRNPDYYPTGYTGYEQYYTDMQGFWRQLYNPDYVPQEVWENGSYKNTNNYSDSSIYFTKTKTWQNAKIIDYNIEYYVSLSNPHILQQYQSLLRRWNEENDSIKKQEIEEQIVKYCKFCFQNGINTDESNSRFQFAQDERMMFWNVDVFTNPEKLNFWIDFLDSTSELQQFSIPVVGDRSKTVNEDKASAIVFKEIPDIILVNQFEKDENNQDTYTLDLSTLRKEITEQSGYTFIYLPKGFSQFLTISYRSISVKDKIDELLYQYAYCVENVSITALPIYHLQPNTRIFVQDKTTNINGEYIVNKITLPLTYNGTMSVSANKAPERFY